MSRSNRKHNLKIGTKVSIYTIEKIKQHPEMYFLKCSNCDSTYWRTRKQVVDALNRDAAGCTKCRKKGSVQAKKQEEGVLTELQAYWLRRAW